MTHWTFITVAYVLTLTGLGSALFFSLWAMRKAEARAASIAGGA